MQPEHMQKNERKKKEPQKQANLFTNYTIITNQYNMKGNPIWEVFIRSKNGLEHRHVGSLHAEDAKMAMENARDVYTRRQEGVSIWVVESKHITASNPSENGEMFDPAKDKAYRHPTFYDLPDELEHI